ncbi:TrkA C-terminal domain-containing protein [Deinococcus multiflagellatus]|uniref:TrkA C-terminal domain-containing protein n=1 Tax=Deinococcus multiflagellatus TaxID=1656887 RepID=A0ABW1ZI89_9DEIO
MPGARRGCPIPCACAPAACQWRPPARPFPTTPPKAPCRKPTCCPRRPANANCTAARCPQLARRPHAGGQPAPGVEIVGVVRDGTVRLPRPQLRLTPNDELVFLARPDAYAALEGILRLPGS